MSMKETTSELSLRKLTDAIIADHHSLFSTLLDKSPALATECFSEGATRRDSSTYFIREMNRYIYSGDTALHIAGASYRREMALKLISAGANIRAKNRRQAEPLHAAATGSPGAPMWDPAAQSATILCLIEAGADPNAQNMDGATPLHLAVRTRCASAVRALLAHGANRLTPNKSGSTAIHLALHTTGHGGSGSADSRAQQEEIIQLLQT
jgi:ankyrin repeat protein